MRWLQVLVVVGMMFFAAMGISSAKENTPAVHDGSKVTFDYTLTSNGNIIDSTKGRTPLEIVQGKGEILPGLAKQLEGMTVGEEKTVVLPPDQAYGQVNPKAMQEVSKQSLPANTSFQVGMYLPLKSPDGRVFPVRVVEVKKDSVVIDFNHPLAGKTLSFQVKIVSIK